VETVHIYLYKIQLVNF